MKVIVKEVIEHYHVIDVDDEINIDDFYAVLDNTNVSAGIKELMEGMDELCDRFGTSCRLHRDGAGQETTSMEIEDEYDE